MYNTKLTGIIFFLSILQIHHFYFATPERLIVLARFLEKTDIKNLCD